MRPSVNLQQMLSDQRLEQDLKTASHVVVLVGDTGEDHSRRHVVRHEDVRYANPPSELGAFSATGVTATGEVLPAIER